MFGRRVGPALSETPRQPQHPGVPVMTRVTVEPMLGVPWRNSPGSHPPPEEILPLFPCGPPAWKWAPRFTWWTPGGLWLKALAKSEASTTEPEAVSTSRTNVTGPTTHDPFGASNVSAAPFAMAF